MAGDLYIEQLTDLELAALQDVGTILDPHVYHSD